MTDDEAGEPEVAEAYEGPTSLDDLIATAIADLGTVERRTTAGTRVFARAGRPFGAATADVLEVRLDPRVAAAALRTPDTTPSARGPGWVSFAPETLDRYAVDRATAWLEHGWRHALD